MFSKALMNTGYDEDPNFLAYFYHSNNGTQSVVKINRFSVVPIYAKPVLPHYYDVIKLSHCINYDHDSLSMVV